MKLHTTMVTPSWLERAFWCRAFMKRSLSLSLLSLFRSLCPSFFSWLLCYICVRELNMSQCICQLDKFGMTCEMGCNTVVVSHTSWTLQKTRYLAFRKQVLSYLEKTDSDEVQCKWEKTLTHWYTFDAFCIFYLTRWIIGIPTPPQKKKKKIWYPRIIFLLIWLLSNSC